MNIVVLTGGISTERDVALSSAALIIKALREEGHRAVLVDIYMGIEMLPENIAELFTAEQSNEQYKVGEIEPDIEKLVANRPEGGVGYIGKNVVEVCLAADIVYLGLHGDIGEDGRLQAFFDTFHIKYTGTGYLGSALAMHKGLTKSLLEPAGIKMPIGGVYQKNGDMPNIDKFPVVVKPCSGGSSVGVYKAENKKELKSALASAFEYEDEVLVEQFILGREFSVGILGDAVLPVIEIIPKNGFYDYKSKYQEGMAKEVCPAGISERNAQRMQRKAKKVFDALKLSVYARVDFLMDANEEIYCLEANTLPGMTPTSLLPQEALAAEINYAKLCNRIIDLSMEKYR